MSDLGVFYARRGHFDHAIAAYRRGLALDGDHSPAIRGLARAHEALGQGADARFYELQGDIHDQLGDRDAARESYKRARTLARRYEMNPTEILGVQGPG